MRFAIIEENEIQNTIIAEKETGILLGGVYIADLPIGVGAKYTNGQFQVPNNDKRSEDEPDYLYFDAPKLPPDETEKTETIEDYLLDLDYRLSLLEMGI